MTSTWADVAAAALLEAVVEKDPHYPRTSQTSAAFEALVDALVAALARVG